MIQMLPEFHIAMAPRRDMKIPLHLIPLQTAINPTTRPRHAPAQPRRLLEPSFLPPMTQHVPHMRILFLLLGQILPLPLQRIHPLNPLSPVRGVLGQHVAREYTIARGVLHVDVQVGTKHRDYDVEVYLQLVRDTFFDAEEVRFVPGIPAAELGEGEEGADYDEEEGCVAAGGGAPGEGGFCFGWKSKILLAGRSEGELLPQGMFWTSFFLGKCRWYTILTGLFMSRGETYGMHRRSSGLQRSPSSPQRRPHPSHGLRNRS